MTFPPRCAGQFKGPRISALSVEALPTSTHKVPWLPSQCLCNAAAAAATTVVSSHILSSSEKYEIFSIQRTRQRKKKNLPPSRLSMYLVPARVSATQLQLWSGPHSPCKRQGGPISRLNGLSPVLGGASRQGCVGAARNISDTLRRRAEVSSPPPHQRQTSHPRQLM